MKTITVAIAVLLASCALYAQHSGGLVERLKQSDKNGDGEIARPQAGERLAALDRYRLCFVRDAALRRQDLKAVEKLLEIDRHVRAAPAWRGEDEKALRDVLGQLETRLGMPRPESLPAELPEETLAFALPRRELRDVRFAESPGATAQEQSLDVYAPATDDRHPMIVWLHGGGMKAGDKAQAGITVLKPDFFLARGFVFISVNYRLAPRHLHPAQAEDTAAALAWVHDHAAEFGGDADNLFVIGISAGAHLAAVVATNERFLAAHRKTPGIIRAAVILDIGSFDIPNLMRQAGPLAPEMYRDTFRDGGNVEDWRDCSPSYHVRPGKAVPPLLLCYVEGREHHAQENERFAKLVQESGGQATVLRAAGKTHLSIETEIGTRSDAVTAAILRFVESRRCRTASRAGVTNKAADDRPPNAVNHQPWVTPPVRAPGVDFRTFESRAAKARVSFHIYTPEAYDREKERRFPVLYWLHGSGSGLRGIPQLARHFDSAIAAGKAPPFLAVFVNGLVEGMYVDWKDTSTPVETVIVKDLVPHVDATWRTIAAREGRMLDGFSMGGYGAARLGFKYPDLFRAVSIVGAGPMQPELVQAPRAGRQRAAEVLQKVYGGDQAYFRSVSPRTLAEQNVEAIAKGSLVRIVIGDQDETFENNREFHEHLERLRIPHGWTVLRGVAHDPMGVLSALGDDNWAFYRAAFGAVDAPASQGEATDGKPDAATTPSSEGRLVPGDHTRAVKGGYGQGAVGRRKGVADFRSVEYTIQAWVKANGCLPEPKVEPLPDKADDGTKVTRKTWSGGRDGSEAVLIEIPGGGHTWPALEPIAKMLGPSTKDISANDLMWEFFQEHPRKPAAPTKP